MANEYFEYINQDRKNSNLVQFYTHTVNNALYLNFTLLNEANLGWINSIAANNRIGFFQDDVLRGSSTILAAFDSEHGFRVKTAPNPELVIGQYYEIKFDEELPPDQIQTPTENRGWSPIYEIEYLTFDDPGYSVSAVPTAIFCFRLADWQSGIGQKPSTGYVGVSGIVADVDNAAVLTLPPGSRGESTKWTSGNAFPASPNQNDMHLFNAAASSLTGYVAADGSTAKTSAVAGEVAFYNGSAWQFVMVLSTGGMGGGTNPFTPTLELGVFENNATTAISGHYARKTDTQIYLSHRNIANEDMSAAVNGLQPGFGLVFGDKIFVAEWFNNNSGYREINGF